jgi:glutamate racemase
MLSTWGQIGPQTAHLASVDLGEHVRIGIFDSGIGGLTVHRELARALPGHELIYLGDTARVPYGTRSPETVIRYSFAVASHLAECGAEALVIACNTATTHALPALKAAGDAAGIRVFGVVEPGVEAAVAAHHRGAIAVLGTEGTIRGQAYQKALALRLPDAAVAAVPCPLLVPLAEEGWLTGEVPTAVAERYLGHLRGTIDTAILGCTHYPLFKAVIAQVLPGVTLVDSAESTAHAVRDALGPGTGPGGQRFVVTDHIDRFQRVGEQFLGARPEPVEWVDVGPPRGVFALH